MRASRAGRLISGLMCAGLPGPELRRTFSILLVKTTFELTKADLDEAVTDYVNKVVEPNEPYVVGQLSIAFVMDDVGATATATVIDSADDEESD